VVEYGYDQKGYFVIRLVVLIVLIIAQDVHVTGDLPAVPLPCLGSEYTTQHRTMINSSCDSKQRMERNGNNHLPRMNITGCC